MMVLVAALAAVAAREAAAQPATASQRAFTSARQALDAAIAAHGGLDALKAIKDVQRTGSGTAYNQGQSLKPGTQYTTRAVTVTTVVDFARGRSATETVTTPAGGLRTPSRAVLKGDEGFTVAVLTNVVSPMSPAAVSGAKTALRRDPVALLLTAAGRAETLRDLGDATFENPTTPCWETPRPRWCSRTTGRSAVCSCRTTWSRASAVMWSRTSSSPRSRPTPIPGMRCSSRRPAR
ncbi:MAG: hypothetical protein E6J91_40385 [Deltaproteobacteria bacterium]|nr:MAG: hypothetical protein E6J91_40385 [Deltaproteobacteria bacterium]